MTDKRIRIILDNSQAKRSARETDQALRDVGKSADSAQFSMNKLAAAIAAVVSVQQITQYADAFTRVQNQITRTTSSAEELNLTTQRLLDLANQTRSGLETTTELYVSLSVSTKDLALSQDELIQVTGTINNLFLESGKGASETAGAIRQLGQALQSGALRGDEFNSVAEGAPGILRAIESATGKTRAELRELAADGAITAEIIVGALQNYSEEAQNAANKTEITLAQSYVIAQNNLTNFVGQINKATGASETFANVIVTATNALSNTENVEFMIDALELLGLAIGSRLAVSIGTSTVAFIAQNAAMLKATVTMNAMGQVVARTTVAQNLLAASSRAAAASMAILGGPVGAVILAATALIYFADKAQETRTESELLEAQIDKVTVAYKDLDEQATKNQISELGRQAESVRKEMELLAEKIREASDRARRANQISMQSGSVAADAVRGLRSEYDSLDNKLKVLIGTQERLRKSIEDPYDFNGEDPFASAPSDPIPRTVSFQPKEESDDTGRREIAQAQNITKQLQNELNLRIQIADIYRQKTLSADETLYEQQLAAIAAREAEELARLQAKAVEDQIRRDEQFRQALENEKLQEEERIILREEQAAQQLLAEQILEQERTAILQEGIDARQQLREAEKQMAISTALSLGGQLMTLAQGQSKRAFEFSKKAALASAIISGGKAAVDAWSAGMSTGGPWAPAVAAAYTAASLLQTGNLIKNIRGQSFSGGGGSGGSTVSAGSAIGGGGGGGSQIPSTVNTPELTQQRRIIEIRGMSPGDLLTGEQVASIFESDDSVIVAFENAREDAQRRNVIGVTAR